MSSWSHSVATDRIETAYAEVRDPEVRPYVRTLDIHNIPASTAYDIDAAHLYIDLRNMVDILGDGSETEQSHKKVLRFLDLQQRAVHRILKAADVIKVDFHGQRLHAVVATPYDDAALRIHRAVAIAQLVADVLAGTDDADDATPAAQVRVGIDSGHCLMVRNGRRGVREPLFLGPAANHAAKHASGRDRSGVYLTNAARSTIGLASVADSAATALTATAIAASQEQAGLSTTADEILDAWRGDLPSHRQKDYTFHRPTPPLSGFDIAAATPSKAGRIEAASIYADLDGFTDFVGTRLGDNERSKEVVRAQHVIRSSLSATLADFGGLHVRFIGDCLHGVLAEGAASTDAAATIGQAVYCVAALRSSFDLARQFLGISDRDLGLAIGVEYGPLALGHATEAVGDLFDSSGFAEGLDYDTVVDQLATSGDESARNLLKDALPAAAAAAVGQPLKAHCG